MPAALYFAPIAYLPGDCRIGGGGGDGDG